MLLLIYTWFFDIERSASLRRTDALHKLLFFHAKCFFLYGSGMSETILFSNVNRNHTKILLIGILFLGEIILNNRFGMAGDLCPGVGSIQILTISKFRS